MAANWVVACRNMVLRVVAIVKLHGGMRLPRCSAHNRRSVDWVSFVAGRLRSMVAADAPWRLLC